MRPARSRVRLNRPYREENTMARFTINETEVWLGEPDAAKMYSSFVEAQTNFIPDEIDGIFLRAMRSDVDAALSHARARLGLS